MAEEEDRPLNTKQKVFADEYLIDLNATRAAIRAGYSEKTARTIAAKLLAKANVSKYIAGLKANRAEKTGIDAAYILALLKSIVETDITQTIRLSREEMDALPKEVRRLVTHVKRETVDDIDEAEAGQAVKGLSNELDDTFSFSVEDHPQKELFTLSFIDKTKAIESLSRHVGFYEEDNAQKSKMKLSVEEEITDVKITITKAK